MKKPLPLLLLIALAGCNQRPGTSTDSVGTASSNKAAGEKPPLPPQYDDKAVYFFSDRSGRGRERIFAFQGTQCAAQDWGGYPPYGPTGKKTIFACKDSPQELMKLVRYWATRQADRTHLHHPHEFFYARVILLNNRPEQPITEFFKIDDPEADKFFRDLKSWIMIEDNQTDSLPDFISADRNLKIYFGEYR